MRSNSFTFNWFLFLCLCLCGEGLWAQNTPALTGVVVDEKGMGLANVGVVTSPIPGGTVTDAEGAFTLIPSDGTDSIRFTSLGFVPQVFAVHQVPEKIVLKASSEELNTIDLEGKRTLEDRARLRSVEGAAIYASKKNEVIKPQQMAASLANNNPREIYAKVPGLNIWESDDGGIQLGVGARGLNPNRTAEFNTRLNGYDMSADALGYPETYYTPPAESLDRIEVVRGAASLQYGTQFGGMINFVHSKGPEDDPFEMKLRLSGGSFGFFNGFTSVGGSTERLNYFGYFTYKRGDGWRPNSEYDFYNGYGQVDWKVTDELSVQVEFTHMNYLAHQPGGLTDAEFATDPTQSNRNRNWFRVDWNLGAIKYQWKPSKSWWLDGRFFGLDASREALGFLGRINRKDDESLPRDLISDNYLNVGTEQRFITNYNLGEVRSVGLVGLRYYRGFLDRSQGDAPATSGPDFEFLNPERKEGSDYDFPSENLSVFAENVFQLSEKWSITPGVRFENITTASDGYYRILNYDLAGNVIFDSVVQESNSKTRNLVLFGLGASYKPTVNSEIYVNASQNYRAINFNDIRVVNPNFKVDPNMEDERGFTIDLGWRGQYKSFITYDVSAFWLRYANRIGTLLQVDPIDRVIVQYRTNIAESNTIGVEGYADVYLHTLWSPLEAKNRLKWFVNATVLSATYANSLDPGIEGNEVEWVPPYIFKSGLNYQRGGLTVNLLGSYTHEHYSDATNAEFDPNAVAGIIPSYWVMDATAQYVWSRYTVGFSINNVLNQSYFSRRASGYPGPGIIPANPRQFILTLGITL